MKTAREFLEKEFHAFGDDELQLYIALNPDVRRIISAMENYAKQKLLQHGVMQAEGSNSAVGAAVGNSAVGQSRSGGKRNRKKKLDNDFFKGWTDVIKKM